MKRLLSSVIVSLLMAVMLCTSMQFTSYAAADSTDSLDYVVSCPNSSDGKHHMKGRSTCWAKNVNTGETRTGMGGQCRYCYMLIVTQNNLFLNPYQDMGWFATRSAWGTQGNNFTMEVTGFSYSSYRDSISQQFLWE